MKGGPKTGYFRDNSNALMESKVIIPLPSTEIVRMLQSHVSTAGRCYNICAAWWSLCDMSNGASPSTLTFVSQCNGRQGTNNSKPCHAHHQSIQLHIQKLCTNTIINGLRLILPPCTPPLDTRVGHAHLWFDGWVWFLWHWWILERMIHQHHH